MRLCLANSLVLPEPLQSGTGFSSQICNSGRTNVLPQKWLLPVTAEPERACTGRFFRSEIQEQPPASCTRESRSEELLYIQFQLRKLLPSFFNLKNSGMEDPPTAPCAPASGPKARASILTYHRLPAIVPWYNFIC